MTLVSVVVLVGTGCRDVMNRLALLQGANPGIHDHMVKSIIFTIYVQISQLFQHFGYLTNLFYFSHRNWKDSLV